MSRWVVWGFLLSSRVVLNIFAVEGGVVVDSFGVSEEGTVGHFLRYSSTIFSLNYFFIHNDFKSSGTTSLKQNSFVQWEGCIHTLLHPL